MFAVKTQQNTSTEMGPKAMNSALFSLLHKIVIEIRVCRSVEVFL